MIVIDTSVWIDVLNDNPAPQAQCCAQLIATRRLLVLPDFGEHGGAGQQ